MGTKDPRTDAELVALAVDGDRDAFAALYARYADSIYDFLVRLVRRPEEAADLTQTAFLRALERLAQLRRPEQFKPWLFSIAYRAALSSFQAQRRVTPKAPVDQDSDAPGTLLSQVDPSRLADPASAAEASEIAALVWQAAAGLDRRTFAVLDLHVRHGLDSREIAEAIGVNRNHAYVLVNRMKATMESALGALLLARRGGERCPGLRQLVRAQPGPIDPSLRRAIERHASRCETCQETRRRLVAPLQAYSALAAVGLPGALSEQIWAELVSAWERHDGPPPAGPRGATRRAAFVAAVIALLLLLPAGVGLGLRLIDRAPGAGAGGEETETEVKGSDPMLAGPASPPAAEGREGSEAASEPGTRSGNALPTPSETAAATPSPELTPAPESTPSPPPSTPTTPPSPTPTATALPPPTVMIDLPDGPTTACHGDTVAFAGSAHDHDGSALDDSQLAWSSDVDGALGTGSQIAAALGPGQHDVTLTATAADGRAGADSVRVDVLARDDPACLDTPPTVAIISPVNGERLLATGSARAGWYADVRVDADVADDRDPPDGMAYQWTSDRDGALLSQRAGTVRLWIAQGDCSTPHTLTLAVTDSGGNSAAGQVSVSVYIVC